jgi:hypothetical protein
LKGVFFPNLEFILECKKFVCGSWNVFFWALHAGVQGVKC